MSNMRACKHLDYTSWGAAPSTETTDQSLLGTAGSGAPDAPPSTPSAIEDVPGWLQIRAGSELDKLVRLVRFTPGQASGFLHSDYAAAGLLWRWALKHFALPPPPGPSAPGSET